MLNRNEVSIIHNSQDKNFDVRVGDSHYVIFYDDSDTIFDKVVEWYHNLVLIHGVDSLQPELPPKNMEELKKLWEETVYTYVDDEVFDTVNNGVARYEKATDKWCPVPDPTINPKKYAILYVHPEEPRFCALTRDAVWKERIKYYNQHPGQISFFLKNCIKGGVKLGINLMMDYPLFSSEFRRDKGLFLKAGRIIDIFWASRISEFDEIRDTLGGYLTDALRGFQADVSMVNTSRKPSRIYDMPTHDDLSSCMAGKDDPERFKLYDDIPTCRIAYIEDESTGLLMARALLWDEVVNFRPIMDTIYFANNNVLETMKKWAEENGYWYKVNQSHTERKFINGVTGEVEDIPDYARVMLASKIKRGMYDAVPFVDTFPTYNIGDNFISVNSGAEMMHDHSEGTDAGSITKAVRCCKCDCHIDEEDDDYERVDDDFYCHDCRDRYLSQCDDCGRYYPNRDVDWVEISQEWLCDDCYGNRYFYCGRCEEDHPLDEKVRIHIPLNVGRGYLWSHTQLTCKKYVEEHENIVQCSHCGDYTTKLVEVDGKMICCKCVHKHCFQCESCAGWHFKNQSHYIMAHTNLGRPWSREICDGCYYDQTGGAYKCDICNEWYWKEENPPISIGYEKWCPSCFKKEGKEAA